MRPDVTERKAREKKVKKKTKTRAGRQVENLASNKQEITSTVTQFIFQMYSMLQGWGGDTEGTWKGSRGDRVK